MPRANSIIDLNSDMGEAFGAYRLGPDEQLLKLVSSANIACGFHAGDPQVMDRTVAAAVAAGVAIGAHVSYPDLVGFGRRRMQVSPEEVLTDTLYQIGALAAFCHRHGTTVRYVKAHGALYNDLVENPELAGALSAASNAYDTKLIVLVLAGSPAVATLRAAGVAVREEAFADRAYTSDGKLVSRTIAGSLLTDVAIVADRVVRMATGQPICDIEGNPLQVRADSVCVHSDTPGALEMAEEMRSALNKAAIDVKSFT